MWSKCPRDNVRKACQRLILTCQRVNKRAKMSIFQLRLPKGMPFLYEYIFYLLNFMGRGKKVYLGKYTTCTQ